MPARRLALVALLVMAVTLSSAPLPFIPDKTQADRKAVQGEWKSLAYRLITNPLGSGLPVGSSVAVDLPDISLAVEGDDMRLSQDGSPMGRMVFRLDGSRNPGR